MTTPTPPDDADTPVEHDLMLPKEVQDYFRIQDYTMKMWLGDPQKRAFPNSFKVGGRWRIPRTDVIDLARRFQQGYEIPDLKKQKNR